MTKAEVQEKINKMVDAVYKIQDAAKQDLTMCWYQEVYVVPLDENHHLKRNMDWYLIVNECGKTVKRVKRGINQLYTHVIPQLIKKYLELCDV